MIKARVTVTLKNGVLDPQGKAIEHALAGLGFGGVGSVRQGKVFDMELARHRQRQGRNRPQGHVRQASGEYGDRELCGGDRLNVSVRHQGIFSGRCLRIIRK